MRYKDKWTQLTTAPSVHRSSWSSVVTALCLDGAVHQTQGTKKSVLNIRANEAGEGQCGCSAVYELLEKAAVTVVTFRVFNILFGSLNLKQAQWPPQYNCPLPLNCFKFYTGIWINISLSLSFSFSSFFSSFSLSHSLCLHLFIYLFFASQKILFG